MTAATSLGSVTHEGGAGPVAPAGRRRTVVTLPRVLMALAIIVLAMTLPQVETAGETSYGLLFAGVPGLAVSVALAAVAFCVAVRRGSVAEAAVAVFVYTICFRIPVALGAPMPIGSATYKHLGIIDYITQNGTVASGVDIYNSWPGAFTAIAWFCQLSGVSALDVAQWFPVVMELAFAGAVYALCRSFGQAPIVALVGAIIAETVNWVGQDYMSPQAITILLAVIILTLLRASRQRPALGWLTVPLFAAITVAHQLTPYWLIGIVFVLGVTGHVRPRWLSVVFGAIAGGYLLAHYGALSVYGLFDGFNPMANAKLIVNGTGSAGLQFTGIAIKITSAGLWGGALLAVALRMKKAHGLSGLRGDTWVALVFAFSPLALLLAQNYGGEAIFRVFLFSIAGCSVLVGPLVAGMLRSSALSARRGLVFTASTAVVVVLALSSLQSFYGGWFSLLVQRDSVVAMTRLLQTERPPANIIALAPVGPNRPVAQYTEFARADRNFDESLEILRPHWSGSPFEAGSADRIADEFADYGHPIYLMMTRQTFEYNDYYAQYPDGALERLVEQLRTSTRWSTVTDTPTLQLFELRPAAG